MIINFSNDSNSGCHYPLHVSDGNKKLVPDKTTAYIIWNLPARITCPYATEHCKAACYAVKAEKAYPDVLPARMDNLAASMHESFVYMMTTVILDKAAHTKKRHIIVRIHESGDFYNKRYAMDWIKIMVNCSVDKRIRFIAYTKSFAYFDGVKLPANFSLRASIWDDTKPERLAIIARNNWPTYTAVDKFRKGDKFTRCGCKNCTTCAKCWAGYKDIRCEIH